MSDWTLQKIQLFNLKIIVVKDISVSIFIWKLIGFQNLAQTYSIFHTYHIDQNISHSQAI